MTDARAAAVTDYVEDRAALRPVAVLLGVGMPVIVVLAAVFGGVTGQEAFLVPAAAALLVWIFTNSMYVFVNWPTGIRIDRDGVRIGNVRHPDANRRHPPAPSLRKLARTSRRATTRGVKARGGAAVGFYLGMLTPPFLRAALVLEIDAEYATFPEFRTHQATTIATSQIGTRSSTWVVPTRHPDHLAATVAAITNSSQWNARRMG
jgi:hypothetical protein